MSDKTCRNCGEQLVEFTERDLDHPGRWITSWMHRASAEAVATSKARLAPDHAQGGEA